MKNQKRHYLLSLDSGGQWFLGRVQNQFNFQIAFTTINRGPVVLGDSSLSSRSSLEYNGSNAFGLAFFVVTQSNSMDTTNLVLEKFLKD